MYIYKRVHEVSFQYLCTCLAAKEFKGLKEAQEEKQNPETASLSTLAVGITSQIHNLRDALASVLGGVVQEGPSRD